MASMSVRKPLLLPMALGMLLLLMMVAPGVKGVEINQPDWAEWTYMDENYTMVCNDSDVNVQPFDIIRWQLPSGEKLDASSDKYTLYTVDQVINFHLTIHNVQESDAGVYFCFVDSMQGSERGQIPKGLNLGGKLYHTSFDKYRDNLLVGGCSAAVVLVLFSSGCSIYKFRFLTDEERQANRERRLEAANRHNRHRTMQGTELPSISANGGDGEVNHTYDAPADDTRM